MTTNTTIDADSSRRSLTLTVARWSQARAHATKSLINDMLYRLELSAFEASHLHATREVLEKVEVELSLLNSALVASVNVVKNC
jgi:hypothetical protein